MSFNANDGFVVKSPVNASLNVDNNGNVVGIDTLTSSFVFASIVTLPHTEILSPTAADVANTGVLYQDATTKGLFYSNGVSLVAVSSGAGSGASVGVAFPSPLGPNAVVGTSIAASHEDHVHALPAVFNSSTKGLVPQASASPDPKKYLTETGVFSPLSTFGASTSGLVPAASITPDATKFLTETGVFANVTAVEVGLGNVDNTSDAVKNAALATLANKTLNYPVINSPVGIAKADVGLGNVDNTSDATKNSAISTLTNKTLVSPNISTISNTGTLTLPISSDTLVGRVTTDTLSNKTISGLSNTLINIPSGSISGIIPMANLATGIPTGSKFVRDDGTLQLIPGGGNALTSNPLSQFATTTSAQLRSTLSDSTGIGSAVFSTLPVLNSPIVGTQLVNDNSDKAASTAYVFNERSSAGTLINKVIDGASNTLRNIPSTSITGVIPVSNIGVGVPTGSKFLRDDGTFQPLPGGGNAITSSPLSQFANTTSAQLAGVMLDETGTGSLVFANSPTLVTPVLGAATATSLSIGIPLPVTSGGIGSASLVPYAPLFGGVSSVGSLQSGSIGSPGQVLTSNGPGALPTFQTSGGSGNALMSSPLSQFAATTSAQLASVLIDETGTGSVVFSNSPVLVSPTLGVATANSVNKVAITAPATGSTLTISDGKTLTVNGSVSFSGVDGSAIQYGSGGTLVYTSNNLGAFASTTSAQLAGIISDKTGSGSAVFSNSPTLNSPTFVTPALGTATATSLTLSAPLPVTSGGLGSVGLTAYAPIFGGTTATAPVQAGSVGAAGQVLISNGPGAIPTFQTLVTGSALITNPLSQFAATTSSQLAGVLTDETGSGSVVFSNSPTLVTPALGSATANSINKVTITAPATGATLSISDNKTLTVGNSVVLTGTDGSTINYGSGGTVAYTSNNLSSFAATTSAQLAAVLSDETGTGSVVFSNSPTLVTPNIGVASATSLSLVAPLSVTSGGLGGASLNAYAPIFGGTTATAPVQSGGIGTAGQVLVSNGPGIVPSFQTFVAGVGNALTSNPLSQFAATTSAQLAGVLTDETGTGSVVFSNSPTLNSPNLISPLLNTASATSLALTTPLAVGSGGLGASSLTAYAPLFGGLTGSSPVQSGTAGSAGQVLISNGANALPTFQTLPGGGNAQTANPLSQFAATTSAQLAGIITDETGTGSLVFAVSPSLTGTPIAPTALAGTNTVQIATTQHVFAERTNSATLTNKTLNVPTINSPVGLVKGDVGLGNVDNTSDISKNSASATLTNKTLTAPVIASIVNTGTLTLPTTTDTLIARATVDTITNKTISGLSNTLVSLPASGIAGVIPMANLATGVPTGLKFIRDDGTLQLIPGSGNVDGGTSTSIYGGISPISGGAANTF